MPVTKILRAMAVAGALSLGASISASAQQLARPAATEGSWSQQDSALVQTERAQWEALKRSDTTAFARLMGDQVVDIDVSGIKRTSRASTARYVLGCRTASYGLSDVRIVHSGETAVVTYSAAVDAQCWGQKAPSPLYVMTVYNERSGAWMPVAHSETPAAHW